MLTKEQKLTIVSEFQNLISASELSKRFNVTRQRIYDVLKEFGVDTSKHKITVSCSCCKKEFHTHKCRLRNKKRIFCSMDCYYSWIGEQSGNPYYGSRQGQRIARAIVSQFFELGKEHVVHHLDKNCLNNDPSNLIVFANQGDHIRFHRGFDVDHLWPIPTI